MKGTGAPSSHPTGCIELSGDVQLRFILHRTAPQAQSAALEQCMRPLHGHVKVCADGVPCLCRRMCSSAQ